MAHVIIMEHAKYNDSLPGILYANSYVFSYCAMPYCHTFSVRFVRCPLRLATAYQAAVVTKPYQTLLN